MRAPRLIDASLACYPAWWRDVYGEEIRRITQDLAADGGNEMRLAGDLLRGALTTRLRGTGMAPRPELWARRTRVSVAVATLPWIVVVPFVLAAMGGHSLRTLSAATLAAPATRISSYAFEVMQLALIVSFCAMAAGWGALVGGVRRAARPHRRHLMLLSCVPLASFLAVLGLFIARMTQLPNEFQSHGGPLIPLDGNPAAAHALLVVLWFALVAGVLASVWSLALVTKHAEMPMLYLRSGKRMATFTAIALTLMAVSAVVGAVAAAYHGYPVPSLDNFLYTGRYASGQYPVELPGWRLAGVPLTAAAVVSLTAWRVARRAWSTTVSLTD